MFKINVDKILTDVLSDKSINFAPGYKIEVEDKMNFFTKLSLGIAEFSAPPFAIALANDEGVKGIIIFREAINYIWKVICKFPKICAICKWEFGGKEAILKKILKEYLIHESRHTHQYEWLKNHGISLNSVGKQNLKIKYWLRPMEIDAYLYQAGIKLPISWLISLYK